MPLPRNGLAWPPAQLEDISPHLAAWSAWYSGDAQLLTNAYAGSTAAPYRTDRPAQYRGGLVGAAARFFWGRPNSDLTKPQHRLHVPVAADLCQASADLLFAEPPSLSVEDSSVQDRLEELVDDGLLSTLAEAAEIGAALGDAYLRVTWDRDLSDRPFLTAVHADAAWPEFRWGRLSAVTFWRVTRTNGQQVWRHLERHELNTLGIGLVLHGLYEGTTDSLGRAVALTEDPSTAPLARLVDAEGAISTQSPGLAVVKVPNQRPQRRWRSHPVGAHLGRSDLDGVEPLMDALDETYSSWMRDLRLGKARILASESVLENLGPGRGAAFDTEQEVFSPLRVLTSREASGLPIEKVQFEIRYEAHAATAQQLMTDILRSAGYSAQTFGEADAGGGDTTATEIQSRERRSFLTRDRKIRLWRPATGEILEKLLAVDAAVFSSGVTPERPDVTFGDSVQDAPQQLATTANLLRQAQAASTRTLVALNHPDWDDTAIDDETAAILAEQGMAVPDPEAGGDQPDLSA